MKSDDEKRAIEELNAKKTRPSTRRERVMVRAVEDIKGLSLNDVVTFYSPDNTVRYYVRLLDPIRKRGVCVFHLNRKGRPSYKWAPSYVVPEGVTCALVFRRELSAPIEEILFRGK